MNLKLQKKSSRNASVLYNGITLATVASKYCNGHVFLELGKLLISESEQNLK